MFKSLSLSFVGVAAIAAATSTALADSAKPAAAPAPAPFTADNPFAKPSSLPMQAPQFDKIKDSDFQPALEEGMRQQAEEVAKIAKNPAAPTFDNTIGALEKSGQLLIRVERVFFGLAGANTNDTIDKVQEQEASKLQAAQDAITLNPDLFKRIETLYNTRSTLKLDPEQLRLVEYYYQEAVLAGAKLSEADKTKLKELNKQEADLTTQFSQKLLKGTKAGGLVVSDKAELAGLSDAELAAAAQAAEGRGLKGKWLIPLQNTTQQPLLQELSNRATREKLFKASWTRTEMGDDNDTRATLLKIADIRAQRAKLLGFSTYADWKLQDQMAKNPEAVTKMLAGLVPPAVARAKAEAADIQALIDQQKGGFKLQPWDWNFYAEQVRKAKYDLDDSQIKPYFELNHVLQDGVFYAANQLYGLTFKERHDLPVYNPDVRVFTVYDKDGSELGLFYCDYYKRDNKGGGAWMDNFVGQSKMLGQKPVVYNVLNITKPAPGQPTLLTWDEATTMFHEFGHALHGLFASQEYPSLSGANTARDWVEFPSQFNEHWASDPKVFAHFAVHYQTGKPMPADLVAKIKKAALFNGGYSITEILGASDLDMQWHMQHAGQTPKDADKFETEALARSHLDFAPVPPRYRSSYFQHIWGNGYAAGYYAYTWTRMLADDSFAWFEGHGGLSRENGQRFRDMILSRGNTEDYGTMYKAFNGHDPDIKPFLKDHGLDEGSK
ncbi:MAG TPA: peptidyl-dipeptidase Dcp [Gammaproteobacteria bacterium]|jgi:peptidyl-dipeptidase Dcp|nr:peptidyl-dipeptidase Dcp [Gammaproteobacteria bacterium]